MLLWIDMMWQGVTRYSLLIIQGYKIKGLAKKIKKKSLIQGFFLWLTWNTIWENIEIFLREEKNLSLSFFSNRCSKKNKLVKPYSLQITLPISGNLIFICFCWVFLTSTDRVSNIWIKYFYSTYSVQLVSRSLPTPEKVFLVKKGNRSHRYGNSQHVETWPGLGVWKIPY